MTPYSDEYMQFNEATGRYVLTEYCLEANGTYLRKRLEKNKFINATAVINRFLTRVSDIIYNYIHTFNIDNTQQDIWIATIESLRLIIKKAMIEQAEYFLLNGDLSRSVEKDKRLVAIDYSVIETLNTTVPELGMPITFSGGY